MKPNISVFFPAYNEEKNIPLIIESAKKVLQKVADKYEIIIVDDGSKDKTGEIADSYAKKYSFVKVVHHKQNRGYGDTLKSGIKKSRYEYIFYTDSDQQFDINEMKKLIPLMKEADIVSAYRPDRKDPKLRIFIGKIYNFLIWLYFGLKIKDVDCAFKMYNKKIFDSFKINCRRGTADAEILIKAKEKGFKIAQIAVKHFPRTIGQSFVNVSKLGIVKPKIIIQLLQEAIKLKKEIKTMKNSK